MYAEVQWKCISLFLIYYCYIIGNAVAQWCKHLTDVQLVSDQSLSGCHWAFFHMKIFDASTVVNENVLSLLINLKINAA